MFEFRPRYRGIFETDCRNREKYSYLSNLKIMSWILWWNQIWIENSFDFVNSKFSIKLATLRAINFHWIGDGERAGSYDIGRDYLHTQCATDTCTLTWNNVLMIDVYILK